MKPRHRTHALLKTVELCKQNGPRPKQRLPDRLKVRMPLHQLFDAFGKLCPRRLANLQPEAAQNPAQAVLEVQQLALHQLARRQHRADLLGRGRLAVYRPEPAEPHQLRDLAGVVAVRLHRHRPRGGSPEARPQGQPASWPHRAIATAAPPQVRSWRVQARANRTSRSVPPVRSPPWPPGRPCRSRRPRTRSSIPMTRRFLHNSPWSSLLDAWSEAYPRLRYTISVRDDRLPSKQAARRAPQTAP